MQDISTYADTNDKLRLLLQGPPGSGKTTIACQFPGAYVIDIDINLGNVIRQIKQRNLSLPIGFDVLDRDEKGEPVEIKQRFLRLDKVLREAQLNPKVETIIIDSGTTLADVLINEICRQQNKNDIHDWKDGRQFWGFFTPLCRAFLGTLASMRKHIILVVHEKNQTTVDERGNTQVVYPIEVAWPGQVGKNIGAFFTSNWRCETKSVGFGKDEKTQYLLRTSPNGMYALKNGLDLPITFEFSWPVIQTALDKGKKIK